MDRQSWLEGTLYRPDFEQDSCGFGLMAQLDDQPSHWLVQTAISSLACLTHRGAVAADGKSGDGCGLLFKKPDSSCARWRPNAASIWRSTYAAGLVFLNQDADTGRHCARTTLTRELQAPGPDRGGLPPAAGGCLGVRRIRAGDAAAHRADVRQLPGCDGRGSVRAQAVHRTPPAPKKRWPATRRSTCPPCRPR